MKKAGKSAKRARGAMGTGKATKGFSNFASLAWRAGNLEDVGERACAVGLHNLYKDARFAIMYSVSRTAKTPSERQDVSGCAKTTPR
jgi:hypothetical protein